MTAFADPIWSTLCFTLGLAVLALAARHTAAALRGPPDTPIERPRSRGLVRGLRALLTGLCLLGLGHGLDTGSLGWTVTCLAIGLEELYETTMALSVLGWCERVAAADADRRPIAPTAAARLR